MVGATARRDHLFPRSGYCGGGRRIPLGHPRISEWRKWWMGGGLRGPIQDVRAPSYAAGRGRDRRQAPGCRERVGVAVFGVWAGAASPHNTELGITKTRMARCLSAHPCRDQRLSMVVGSSRWQRLHAAVGLKRVRVRVLQGLSQG